MTKAFVVNREPVELGQVPRQNKLLLYHFPIQFTPFYGRKAELEELRLMLLSDKNRMVTVYGPGGVGNTRLCIQVADLVGGDGHFITDRFTNGVYFFSLHGVETAEDLLGALLGGLRLPVHENGGTRRQLRHYLQDKACLLLLDNFEHLVRKLRFCWSCWRVRRM